jgi:hypothetical protein
MASEQKQRPGEVPENMRDAPRRPFEAFDFDKLPLPRADDPPYRPWWVVSDQGR